MNAIFIYWTSNLIQIGHSSSISSLVKKFNTWLETPVTRFLEVQSARGFQWFQFLLSFECKKYHTVAKYLKPGLWLSRHEPEASRCIELMVKWPAVALCLVPRVQGGSCSSTGVSQHAVTQPGIALTYASVPLLRDVWSRSRGCAPTWKLVLRV